MYQSLLRNANHELIACASELMPNMPNANGGKNRMKDQATLELPVELYDQLSTLAKAEHVPVPVLIERLAASHRRPLPTPSHGTILGEAVPHEEIHVWDRPHDDNYSMYMGDYAD
jgi:hypothetical protein